MNLSIRQRITRNLLNIPGYRTSRKIIVIESDDWGSVRMASRKSFSHLLKMGYPVDQCPYNSYDALESGEDLAFLFGVLNSVKDRKGNPAVFTANNIVANPDFVRIREHGYQSYFYEKFTDTYLNYPKHQNSFSTWKEGLEAGVFYPQSHGREHLNVNRWMRELQRNDKDTHAAFSQGMFTLHTRQKPANINEYMDALDYDSEEEKLQREGIVEDGLKLFNEIWGFKSRSFIASSYIWDKNIEPVLKQGGVDYLQGSVIQKQPTLSEGPVYIKKYHFQGQKNNFGQRFLIRNAFFEPSHNREYDWVNDCLHRISIAFKWQKPAIISTHRVNYIGFIHESNRDHSLKLLKQLLGEIIKQWPEAEFLTSDRLGDHMNNIEVN